MVAVTREDIENRAPATIQRDFKTDVAQGLRQEGRLGCTGHGGVEFRLLGGESGFAFGQDAACGDAFGVRRRSALSARRVRRYSAREVNMR